MSIFSFVHNMHSLAIGIVNDKTREEVSDIGADSSPCRLTIAKTLLRQVEIFLTDNLWVVIWDWIAIGDTGFLRHDNTAIVLGFDSHESAWLKFTKHGAIRENLLHITSDPIFDPTD